MFYGSKEDNIPKISLSKEGTYSLKSHHLGKIYYRKSVSKLIQCEAFPQILEEFLHSENEVENTFNYLPSCHRCSLFKWPIMVSITSHFLATSSTLVTRPLFPNFIFIFHMQRNIMKPLNPPNCRLHEHLWSRDWNCSLYPASAVETPRCWSYDALHTRLLCYTNVFV